LFFFCEYRNPVLSRGTWICRFWLRTSAQENPYKYLWATKILQNDILRVSMPKPESPGICPEYPGTVSGVSGHIPGVSRYPFTNG
jgi:hypothetical protein